VFGGSVHGKASNLGYKLDMSQVNWFNQKEVREMTWEKI